ncbi:MAG TPA: MFS transporter [Chloroflexota bacterium]|nr:MFS transporter [Chloroflexota bacterium]
MESVERVGGTAPTTTPPPPAINLSVSRRNVALFVADAAIFSFALSFLDLSSVMPTLLSHLTRLPLWFGLLGSIQTGCWLLPQIFVARLVGAQRRKLPIVILGTTLSRFSWLFLVVGLVFTNQIGPDLTLVCCYLAVAGFFLFDGVAILPWYDLLARAVPASLRGRLFGLLALGSGITATVGGIIVEHVVGNPSLPYPADYRLLAIAAVIILMLGVIPLALVKEAETEEATPAAEPFKTYFRRLPSLLRQRPTFRRLVAIQILVGISAMATPFYAPFADLGLGIPESTVGAYIIGVTMGSMLGGMAWGWIGDHGPKEVPVRIVALAGGLAPLVPIILAFVARGLPPAILGPLLALSFFCVGCGVRSGWVAYANFVMEIATPADRPTLIGLMNTLSGFLAIVPPLGGLLAGWLGYEATFLAASLPALVGLGLSFALRAEPASASIAAI